MDGTAGNLYITLLNVQTCQAALDNRKVKKESFCTLNLTLFLSEKQISKNISIKLTSKKIFRPPSKLSSFLFEFSTFVNTA